MQESEEDEDVQPFAKLFARVSAASASSETPMRAPPPKGNRNAAQPKSNASRKDRPSHGNHSDDNLINCNTILILFYKLTTRFN